MDIKHKLKTEVKKENDFKWENCHVAFADLSPFQYETAKSNLSQNNQNFSAYKYFHKISYTEVRSILPKEWMTDDALFCCVSFVTHRIRKSNKNVHIVHPSLSKLILTTDDPKTNFNKFDASTYETGSLTLHPCQDKGHWTILFTYSSDEGMLGGVFDGLNNTNTPTPSCEKLFNKIAEYKGVKNKLIYQQNSTSQLDGNTCGIRVVLAAQKMTSEILRNPKLLEKKMFFENSDSELNDLSSYILRRISVFLNF